MRYFLSNYQPIFSDKEFSEVVNPRKLDVKTASQSINSKIVFKTTQSILVKTIPPSTIRPNTSAIELIGAIGPFFGGVPNFSGPSN